MAESGVFKTSAVGGFDKRSVLSYIDSMNENFKTIEHEYQTKLDEFSKSQESQIAYIKKLEAQIAQKDAEFENLQSQMMTEQSKIEQTKSVSEHQVAQMQKRITDLERDIQIQIERNRQLQFKIESVDYKSKKYDEFSTQIGDALIEAKKNAEQIVEQANVKARGIVSQAEHYMRNFQSELGSFQSDTHRLRKSVEEILFVLNDRVDIMQEIVKQVENRINYDPQVEFDDTGRAMGQVVQEFPREYTVTPLEEYGTEYSQEYAPEYSQEFSQPDAPESYYGSAPTQTEYDDE